MRELTIESKLQESTLPRLQHHHYREGLERRVRTTHVRALIQRSTTEDYRSTSVGNDSLPNHYDKMETLMRKAGCTTMEIIDAYDYHRQGPQGHDQQPLRIPGDEEDKEDDEYHQLTRQVTTAAGTHQQEHHTEYEKFMTKDEETGTLQRISDDHALRREFSEDPYEYRKVQQDRHKT
eukprot:2513532-Amphidinium_carterae.1